MPTLRGRLAALTLPLGRTARSWLQLRRIGCSQLRTPKPATCFGGGVTRLGWRRHVRFQPEIAALTARKSGHE